MIEKPPLSLTDHIRAHIDKYYVQPILRAGRSAFSVRAGDVHDDLELDRRHPAVCNALEAKVFAKARGIVLTRKEGPPQGANTVFHFRVSRQPQLERTISNSQPASTGTVKTPPCGPLPTGEGVVYLVSCASKKRVKPAPAKDLYVSPFFRKARRLIEDRGSLWFILSAEHGLVHPDQVMAPYDNTLNGMAVRNRRRWASRVIAQFDGQEAAVTDIVFLAGLRYREFLTQPLEARGLRLHVPMQRLGIGQQLEWLDRNAEP